VIVEQARLQVKQKVEDDKRRQYKGTVCQNKVQYIYIFFGLVKSNNIGGFA
jgi:hypothetical protein